MRSAILVLLVALAGCASLEPAGVYVPEDGQGYLTVVDTLAMDSGLSELVAPYRSELEGEMSRVIGRAATTLTKGSPEGILGNMAADAMLFALEQKGFGSADVALTNNGGLRVPLNEGPITVGRVFELMPFENMLVVLSMPADSLVQLAHDLARAGGEPIAGLSFAIREEDDRTMATDIRVGGQPVEPGRTYRVATSDYLANGGGSMPTLWAAYPRETPDMKLRDAFLMYIEAREVIAPEIEGRIRRE